MKRFWRKWFATNRARSRRPGTDTRLGLESGVRHLRAGGSLCGRETRCQAHHLGAAQSFESALKRRPDLIEAHEGRTLGLCAIALCRMARGEDAPPEWTSAVRACGRVLGMDSGRPRIRLARAALYLAAAAALRASGQSPRAAVDQAAEDISVVLERPPQRAVGLRLRELVGRLRDTETAATVGEIREAWGAGAMSIPPWE